MLKLHQPHEYLSILPKEIILTIRSFLVLLSLDGLSREFMEYLYYVEGRRSWNNFLSISNKEDWKRIRRETIYVTLGPNTSKKYLCNESFRNFILGMIDDPYHQLALTFDKYSFNNSTEEQNILRNLSSLSISNSVVISPAVSHVQFVGFAYCESLKDISNCHQIQHLTICYCSKVDLSNSDCTGDLISLRICGNVKSLPELESMKSLQSLVIPDEYRVDLSHFHQLRSLIITGAFFQFTPMATPLPVCLPSLQALSLEYLPTGAIDFSRVPRLTDFHNYKMQARATSLDYERLLVNDLYAVGPQLSRVSTQFFMELPCDILATRLPHARSFDAYGSHFTGDEFLLGETVRSVKLSRTNIRTIVSPPTRVRPVRQASLVDVKLDFSSAPLMSWLGGVTEVILNNNKNLIDVSALVSVPYLSLSRCDNVTNFFVLGKQQRALWLEDNPQLVDEDLPNFSDVPYLFISGCHSITDLSGLRGNHSVIACNLQGIKETQVYQRDCALLDLSNSAVRVIEVMGQVHHLKVPAATEVTDPENVRHLILL